MGINLDVSLSGPLFDGRAESAIAAYCTHTGQVISDRAVSDIREYLPTQYKYLGHNGGTPRFNPIPPNAGYLASQVHSERQTPETLIVTDSPVIYGAWIEGVSGRNMIVWPHRRNPPPRRFPGYHAFRKIAQRLAGGEALAIAERELQAFLPEMR